MATNVSYPGVYIEEVPSGVRSIAGVPTSVAAFVGYTARGAVNEPTQIFSFADFERKFGGLSLDSDLSYAVSHFYLNGGSVAWIVRVAANADAAAVTLLNAPGGVAVLTATAKGEGLWGNSLRLTVDYDTSNPASLFNLTVQEFQQRSGQLQAVRTEVHRNLSMNSFASNYAVNVVNAASSMISLERKPTAPFAQGVSRSGIVPAADLVKLDDDARRLAISIDGGTIYEFDLWAAGAKPSPLTLADVATLIDTEVGKLEPANPAFTGFTCVKDGTQDVLVATSVTNGERSSVVFANAGERNAAAILKLGLANGGRETSGAATARPAQSGTVWKRQDPAINFAKFPATADPFKVDLIDANNVTIGAQQTLNLWTAPTPAPTDLAGLAGLLQAELNKLSGIEYAGARAVVVDGTIVVIPGGADPSRRFEFTAGLKTTGPNIDISGGGAANVAAYQLGVGPTSQAQNGALGGSDGTPPSPTDLAGSQANKTGIYALEKVDLFNLLLLPNQSDPSLQATAIAYAEMRRAFVLLDLPVGTDTLVEAQAWLTANGGLRHKNAAAYFPRARFADPLQDNRLRSFANSGAVAGVYARTDASRGVWKAPAGTEAVVRGVRELEYVLTDGENGVINPLGLNALRLFPAFGPIAWGARTLVGSDTLASEWKYVPVRRLALFIEESLYRGTQWVVFEPNDEPLWAQIRLNVGAFMHNLFRQGAFQGMSPKEAYLVQCDSSTTTQDDINLGIVNIIVGFAPLKPAEFVIIKLQQLAGQAGAGA
ncbi:MAG TPA: phage tail sheath C-terminal domain-containing protein [Allosphingosinicella sp.]|nr:phage tail sheath C-terminal domain-containing protein [Allosphingosinicella sp.]